MAKLLSDENFRFGVVLKLRQAGHDVVTAQAEGLAGQADRTVLEHATKQDRAVLTFNRWHFIGLHRKVSPHGGILACTEDHTDTLTKHILDVLAVTPDLRNQLTNSYL
jgi:hypothetical protein